MALLRTREKCWRILFISVAVLISTNALFASDHADPIDPLNRKRLEGGITDLFVFPVDKEDQPYKPFTRSANLPLHDILADLVREPQTDADRKQIDAIVFILCVRRQLTNSKSLKLEPFSYRIHIDVDSDVKLPKAEDVEAERKMKPMQSTGMMSSGYGPSPSPAGQMRPTLVEAFARYGGQITEPANIKEDITMEFRFNNDAKLKPNYPVYSGAASAGWAGDRRIRIKTGVFDDPFIFPAFFGTNVVAIAIRVPFDRFPQTRTEYLIWADSRNGTQRVDHVGRSLRTQNPRFELLNTIHPSQHVAAIMEEHEHPSLMRDIGLRLNFGSYYAYRRWDFVPDVMCYSTRLPVGYPNGRVLTDDVAAMLAQHGDTLLYELSYQDNNGRWPRQMTNDRTDGDFSDGTYRSGSFNKSFPYLLPPFEDRPQPPPRRLTNSSILKLTAIVVTAILLLVLENWLVARLYHRRKLRQRYL